MKLDPSELSEVYSTYTGSGRDTFHVDIFGTTHMHEHDCAIQTNDTLLLQKQERKEKSVCRR